MKGEYRFFTSPLSNSTEVEYSVGLKFNRSWALGNLNNYYYNSKFIRFSEYFLGITFNVFNDAEL